MGYSTADTAKKHERILDESIRLFRDRGFSGVSVSEVMKAAGLTHGPFYHHFASKEELVAETLTRELRKALLKLDKYPASEEGKAQFTDGYLSEGHRDECSTGCCFAALSSDVRKEKRQVRTPFTELLKNYIQKLATGLPWPSKKAARGDAIHLLSTLVGAVILARAVDDDVFSKEILDEVRKRA